VAGAPGPVPGPRQRVRRARHPAQLEHLERDHVPAGGTRAGRRSRRRTPRSARRWSPSSR
jgi:hypothetical protein